MIVPNEDRARMAAYRNGLKLVEFLDAMWLRRQSEHGDKVDPTPEKTFGAWNWPAASLMGRRLKSSIAELVARKKK